VEKKGIESEEVISIHFVFYVIEEIKTIPTVIKIRYSCYYLQELKELGETAGIQFYYPKLLMTILLDLSLLLIFHSRTHSFQCLKLMLNNERQERDSNQQIQKLCIITR